MEERKLKINFNKSGSGSYTPKIALPMIDVRKMKITPEDRQIQYYYSEENDIIIFVFLPVNKNKRLFTHT